MPPRLMPLPSLARQRLAVGVAGAIGAALLLAGVFGSRGLLHLRTLTIEEDAITQRIASLLRGNAALREELHRLRTDDRALERRVREELGYVRDGEIVYRFPGRTTRAPAAPAPPPR